MVLPINEQVQGSNGIWTMRAAAAVPQNAFQNLFTIATGNILLLFLVGERTVIQGGGVSNMDFQIDPTAGAAVALCIPTVITTDAVGTIYTLTGNPADAVYAGLASMSGMSGGALATGQNTQGWIVPPGTIDYRESAAAGTGQNQFYACWVPIDAGATLVAA